MTPKPPGQGVKRRWVKRKQGRGFRVIEYDDGPFFYAHVLRKMKCFRPGVTIEEIK